MSAAKQTREQRYVQLCLQGASPSDIALALDVSERTVRNYASDPQVREQLRQGRAVVLGRTLDLLSRGAAASVITLSNLLVARQEPKDSKQPPKEPAGVRVRAALGILDQYRAYYQCNDLDARLAELEALVRASLPAKGISL